MPDTRPEIDFRPGYESVAALSEDERLTYLTTDSTERARREADEAGQLMAEMYLQGCRKFFAEFMAKMK